jgi:hypothetical protein
MARSASPANMACPRGWHGWVESGGSARSREDRSRAAKPGARSPIRRRNRASRPGADDRGRGAPSVDYPARAPPARRRTRRPTSSGEIRADPAPIARDLLRGTAGVRRSGP